MHSYDSDERVKRRDVAEDTLDCIKKGKCGEHPITNNTAKSWVWIEGEDCPVLGNSTGGKPSPPPTYKIYEATTLSVSERYRDTPHLGVLNFASARNPGGGFHTGANAQEESLARSTSMSRFNELIVHHL